MMKYFIGKNFRGFFFFASSLATSQAVLNNLKIYVDIVFMFMHERENREI